MIELVARIDHRCCGQHKPLRGTSLALLDGMLAAFLIPLIFIVGLLVLILLGAWPMGVLPSLVIIALLSGVAIGLVRMARTNDAATAK